MLGIIPNHEEFLKEFPKVPRNIFKLALCKTQSPWLWNGFIHNSTLQLSAFVKELIEPLSSNRLIYEKIELGLHEALINAVKHGNLSDNSKQLRVRRVITPNWYIWQIKDEGNGTPQKYRYGVLPKKLDSEGGRGIYIIYQCFDDVRWSAKGNQLQLAFKRK